MLVKRHYKKPEGWIAAFNVRDSEGRLRDMRKPAGACLNPPPVDFLEVYHTGVSAKQNFSDRLIAQGIAEGWVSIGKGLLTVHAAPEDLTYKILRTPGYYCCHCGEQIVDAGAPSAPESAVTLGVKHVAEAHGSVKSPDSENPSGYLWSKRYSCELLPDLHEKFHFREGMRRG